MKIGQIIQGHSKSKILKKIFTKLPWKSWTYRYASIARNITASTPTLLVNLTNNFRIVDCSFRNFYIKNFKSVAFKLYIPEQRKISRDHQFESYLEESPRIEPFLQIEPLSHLLIISTHPLYPSEPFNWFKNINAWKLMTKFTSLPLFLNPRPSSGSPSQNPKSILPQVSRSPIPTRLQRTLKRGKTDNAPHPVSIPSQFSSRYFWLRTPDCSTAPVNALKFT